MEVSKEMIQTFNSQYSERVIGQERAKKKLLQAIYPLVDGKQSKPVVNIVIWRFRAWKDGISTVYGRIDGWKIIKKAVLYVSE